MIESSKIHVTIEIFNNYIRRKKNFSTISARPLVYRNLGFPVVNYFTIVFGSILYGDNLYNMETERNCVSPGVGILNKSE